MPNVGDITDLTEVYRDSAGALVVPDTLEVDVFPPSADLTGDSPDPPTTYVLGTDTELAEVEEGVYRLAIEVNEAGGWRYRWRSTGPGDVRVRELWVTSSDFDTAPTTGMTPTIEEVADLLLDHRSDALGNDLRTFTDDTKPSARDAHQAIARAERMVRAKTMPALEASGVSAQAAPLARDAIAHRAAMTLVMHLPDPESEYERLRQDFDGLMTALDDLLEGDGAGGIRWASIPLTSLGLHEA